MNFIRGLALASLFALSVVAQNAALMPMPKPMYFDNNGVPLAGGLIYTYAAGTTTPLATYTDSTAGTANSNPVVLDSTGRASIWLGASNYKIVAETSLGVIVWTVDNVSSVSLTQLQGNGSLASLTVSGSGTIGGALTVSGAVTAASGNITGALTVGGTGTFQNVNVTGNGSFGGALSVTGAISGNLTGNVTGNVTGNASTATALAATPTGCSSGQYATGIAANGNLTCAAPSSVALQSVEGGACTTGSTANAQCTITLNWGTAYSSTSYHASCSLIGPFTGFPNIVGLTKSTSGVTVTIENGQGSAAQVSTAAAIDCLAN